MPGVGVSNLSRVRRTPRYAKRVHKTRKDCLQAIVESNKRYGMWAASHRRALESRHVPKSLQPLHEALLGSIIDLRPGGPATTLVDTALPRRRAIERLAAAMGTPEKRGAQREYLGHAKRWWAATNRRLADFAAESEQLMSAAIAQHQKLTPPKSLSAAHVDLEAGLQAEYVAWVAFDKAMTHLDAEAAIAAHDALEPARAQIRRATSTISTAAFG